MKFFLLLLSGCVGFPIRKLFLYPGLSRVSRPDSSLYASNQLNVVADFIKSFPQDPKFKDFFMNQLNALLLDHDPSTENNAALKVALELGDKNVIDLLLKNQRVHDMILQNRKLILEHDIKSSPLESFYNACSTGDTDYILAFLLLDDLQIDSNKIALGFEVAAKAGKLDVIKLLFKDSRLDLNDWSDDSDSNPLLIAATEGNAEVVSFLLNWFDPSASENLALFMASFSNRPEVVDILLQDPRVDPTAVENQAFLIACYAGNTEVVERLLKDGRIVPSIMGLKDALESNHFDIVQLICNHLGLDPNDPDSWN